VVNIFPSYFFFNLYISTIIVTKTNNVTPKIQAAKNFVLIPTTPSLKKFAPSSANEEEEKQCRKKCNIKNQLTSISKVDT